MVNQFLNAYRKNKKGQSFSDYPLQIRILKIIVTIYFTATVSCKSLSTKILPQFSHTITFLCNLISLCFCGGIALKQPPQASLSTGTTDKPFL